MNNNTPSNSNNGKIPESSFKLDRNGEIDGDIALSFSDDTPKKAPANQSPKQPQARPVPQGGQPSGQGTPRNAADASTKIVSIPSAPVAKQGNEATRQIPDETVKLGDVTPGEGAPRNGTQSRRPNSQPRSKGKQEYSEANNTVMSLIKCMAYITVVFVISAIISMAVIFAANDIFAFVKSDEVMEIEIPEGADFGDIADILHDNKIINYKLLFKMYMGGKVKDVEFEPGTYSLSPITSYSDLVYTLRKKAPSGISYITIPEGYTTDEIIDLMVSYGIGTKEGYIDVINNYDFDYWFIDELGDGWADSGRFYRLDGYLYPDSYQFYNASSEVTVINKLLARFDAVFSNNFRTSAEDLGYTVDEILIIASIIEKEGGSRSEFNYVSSVFHNRLNSQSFQYLESDATIAYAIHHATGTRPVLTGDDLTYDSPYNSYTNPGLCPGPIANPSNSAILAALNPAQTSYYFFVSDGAQTYFSESKWEHDQKVAEIQSRNS